MSSSKSGNTRLSRRNLFKAAAAVAAALGAPAPAMAHGHGHSPRRREDDDPGSLVLTNGRIHTMDDRNSVVSAVTHHPTDDLSAIGR